MKKNSITTICALILTVLMHPLAYADTSAIIIKKQLSEGYTPHSPGDIPIYCTSI